MKTLQVKVMLLNPKAAPPYRATPGSAAFDLCSAEVYKPLFPGDKATFRTGIAVELPEGAVMHVYSRSGHGFKNGVRLANCVGVIDSDYRGEIMIRLVNEGFETLHINPGDRIAQAVFSWLPATKIEIVNELSETERGEGGIGSTGVSSTASASPMVPAIQFMGRLKRPGKDD